MRVDEALKIYLDRGYYLYVHEIDIQTEDEYRELIKNMPNTLLPLTYLQANLKDTNHLKYLKYDKDSNKYPLGFMYITNTPTDKNVYQIGEISTRFNSKLEYNGIFGIYYIGDKAETFSNLKLLHKLFKEYANISLPIYELTLENTTIEIYKYMWNYKLRNTDCLFSSL